MVQTVHVVGTVQYREGDGPMLTIRPGPVEVETTGLDAVLSWSEIDSEGPGAGNEVRYTAALPKVDYQRLVTEGAIRLNG